MVYVYEVDEGESRQHGFQNEYEGVAFDRHEISTLDYVGKDQDFEKDRAA